jgi:hypothetical protein
MNEIFMPQDINRRETRVPAHFKPQKFTFSLNGVSQAKRMLMKDVSGRGLGCISWGSQFLGRGCKVTCGAGMEYTIRWVKVRFGFLYEFGLEKIEVA